MSLGESIPKETPHAVSVSLPTWASNVGYEEGQEWVVSKLTTGYPRFFIHLSIQAFTKDILDKFGKPGQCALLFPTRKTADRCVDFVKVKSPKVVSEDLSVLHFVLDSAQNRPQNVQSVHPEISAVVCTEGDFPFAKQYWQHSGDGISSRRAEFCHRLFNDGILVLESSPSKAPLPPRRSCPGPRRYQRKAYINGVTETQSLKPAASPHESSDEVTDSLETSEFLEERFGRNLNISLVNNAKSAIRRRIAGVLDVDLAAASFPAMHSSSRGVTNFKEDDIYLVPCGMNAIFTTHQMLLKAQEPRNSICFGFTYVDTLKILEKFGPGCVFYPRATPDDLDDLENRLKGGERFLALFCEFPGNPLLTCPDLQRIRRLADTYNFVVVVDETVGTFVNVNVLPCADVVVSSLTKIFSGDCNVMGGSIVLNPDSRHYDSLKTIWTAEFEDTYWAEDAIYLERNSRDFVDRIHRINKNAEMICDILKAHPAVKRVYYPKYNDTLANYEACKVPGAGYGGLLSCTFQTKAQAVAFYDAVDTAKGPSLGTNFTLTSPYVILAHYQELEWVAKCGVDPNLIRISVGLEDPDDLRKVFEKALEAA